MQSPSKPGGGNSQCLHKGMPPKLSKETRTPLRNLSWPVARAIAFEGVFNGDASDCQLETQDSCGEMTFP